MLGVSGTLYGQGKHGVGRDKERKRQGDGETRQAEKYYTNKKSIKAQRGEGIKGETERML